MADRSELEAILGAIIDRSRKGEDDTTDRLAYADWLEEHGDGAGDLDRATFIRTQIKAHGLPEGTRERGELFVKAKELRNKHPEWEQPLTQLSGSAEVL